MRLLRFVPMHATQLELYALDALGGGKSHRRGRDGKGVPSNSGFAIVVPSGREPRSRSPTRTGGLAGTLAGWER
jgi:hypothetical protein